MVFRLIYQRLAFVAEETYGLSSNFTQSDEMVTRSMKEETVLFASFIKWLSATPFFQDKCASPLCTTEQLFIVYREFKKTSEGKIRIIGMKDDMKKKKKRRKKKREREDE